MALIFILLTQLINQTTSTLAFQVDHGRRLLPELPPGKTRFAKQSRVLRRLRREYESGWKIRVLLDGEFTGIELDPRVVLKYVRVVFRVEGPDLDVLCVHGVRENRCSDYLLRHRYFGCMRNFFWDGRTAVSIDRSDTRLATKLRKLEGHCEELAPFVDISPIKKGRKRLDSPHVTFVVHKDNENKIESLQCPSPKEVAQRERPRNDFRPPMRFGEQTTFDNEYKMNATKDGQKERLRDDPRPLGPPEVGSGGQTIGDNEDSFSTTNAIEDSFVYGVLFVLAMMVCVLMEFL